MHAFGLTVPNQTQMEVSSMDKVEFIGSVTEMGSAVVDDDDDGFCPSDSGRSVCCCSAGLD
jgi:hypothetical protein